MHNLFRDDFRIRKLHEKLHEVEKKKLHEDLLHVVIWYRCLSVLSHSKPSRLSGEDRKMSVRFRHSAICALMEPPTSGKSAFVKRRKLSMKSWDKMINKWDKVVFIMQLYSVSYFASWGCFRERKFPIHGSGIRCYRAHVV